MKTIFLTGSKGFIGKHLLPKLTDYHVYCGGYNELPPVTPDYIIHLAAVTTTSDKFIPELYESNIIYAKQIMSIPTRIIYASSTSAAELTNPYARTKRYIEYLGSNCNAIGLRFFNVYGPGNNKGIVKKAIECVKTGENMFVSDAVRDYIYIDDVVNAIIANLDNTQKILEVGTGVGLSTNKALRTICKIMGGILNCNDVPRSYTDMEYSVANPGIPGCLTFEQGLRKMLEL